MTTEIVFSEIINTNGNINKRFNKNGKKLAAANVLRAKGRTVRLELEGLAEYLDSLNGRPDAAIVLGISGLDEFEIRLKGKEDREKGIISRSKDYFEYVNSDSVGIMYFDIDGGSDHGIWEDVEIDVFLERLEKVLEGSLIGVEGHDRSTLCRWVKKSSSAGVVDGDGRPVGFGYHIYFPVRNPSARVVELIHNWAWLNGFRSHLVDKSGGCHIRTIIDSAVRGPERLVFESDCTLVKGNGLELVVRECSYVPGGILDSELAINALEEAIGGQYEIEIGKYLKELKSSPEVVEVRKKYDRARIKDLVDKGVKRKTAVGMVQGRRAGKILSSDFLTKDDGSEVQVYDILTDSGSWDGAVGFRPPMEPEYGKSKCKIFVNDDENVMLNSFAHGGQVYRLMWDYDGLLRWLGDAGEEEVDEFGVQFIANSDLTNTQRGQILKRIAKAVGGTKGDLEADVMDTVAGFSDGTMIRGGNSVDGEIDVPVEEDATHHEISEAFLNSYKSGYMVFGSQLYSFGRTIWKKQGPGVLLKRVAVRYKTCDRCKKVTDYNQIVKHTLVTARNKTEDWSGEYGFACSNWFWKVDVAKGEVEQLEYKREFGCRHKMTFEPDFEMKTPYWDKVLGNVVNRRCFQQVCGLALSGVLNSYLQKVGVFKGAGGTGKGTTNHVMSAMLPAGRIKAVSVGQMNMPERRGDLADCVVNFIPEMRKDRRNVVNMEGFKMCTGGDLVSGRNLFKDQFYFMSKASQILNMNDWPALDSFGSDIERRLGSFIVEFRRNHDEADESLLGHIIEHELPGVLAWFINGVVDYFDNGIDSGHSQKMFRSWAKSIDSVESFIVDCCQIRFGQGIKVVKTGLADAYKIYCRKHGLEEKGRNAFYDSILSYPKVDSGREDDGTRVFRNIELLIQD